MAHKNTNKFTESSPRASGAGEATAEFRESETAVALPSPEFSEYSKEALAQHGAESPFLIRLQSGSELLVIKNQFGQILESISRHLVVSPIAQIQIPFQS